MVHAATETHKAVAPAPSGRVAIELRERILVLLLCEPVHHRTGFMIVEVAGDDNGNVWAQSCGEPFHFAQTIIAGSEITADSEAAAIGNRRAQMNVQHLN